MGRLVYVREVSRTHPDLTLAVDADKYQDREAEPRFSNAQGGGARGGFGGGMQGGYGGGGGGGGYGGGMMGGGGAGGGAGGAGRQIYVSNVCYPPSPTLLLTQAFVMLTALVASLHCWLAGPQRPFPASR